MTRRVHHPTDLIYSAGTQVVTQTAVDQPDAKHPKGAVGVVVHSASSSNRTYRVRFLDGSEATIRPEDLVSLARHKEGDIADPSVNPSRTNLYERVIYRCIIGSRAYGLAEDNSDTDRRGIYLPPADLHWSLYGVPEQLENEATQEAYWELQKFLVLALKANPNVLECLYSPMVESATPLARELIQMRSIFVSRLVYGTYNGYVMSQFKKMQSAFRNQGRVKWKHVMHLVRLLLSGIEVLRTGHVPVDVGKNRERLLAIRRGEVGWEDVEIWQKQLHGQFDLAFSETTLPDRPDYERASKFLIDARRRALTEALP